MFPRVPWRTTPFPAHPERCLDYQRHGPLWRIDVRGRRERQERHENRPPGCFRGCLGVRHHSPRTLNDAWITNGMARYGELMYVEEESGNNAMKTALQDVSAGALAYDTIPLSSAGRMNPFSPEFQSMTLEQGAM